MATTKKSFVLAYTVDSVERTKTITNPAANIDAAVLKDVKGNTSDTGLAVVSGHYVTTTIDTEIYPAE